MKIAYIANIRFPTEKAHGIQIAKACEALIAAGADVTLIIPNRKTPITASASAYYRVVSFPIRKVFTMDVLYLGRIGFWIQSITFAFSALAIVRAEKSDVVYGRDELVLWALYLGGIRNLFWESHDGTWNIFSRFIAKKAVGIVVVSEGLKRFYIEKGVSKEKIYSTPNGITVSDFSNPESKESARQRLGLPRNKNVALYIGRLDGWKGADTLLEASELLPPEVVVALIGGENEQIDVLKVKYPKAIFLGYKPYSELPNNQSAGDVLVVPNTGKSVISAGFTSPLKLIAHMASKRPIVASDLPSIRELVGENEAVLVAPDDAKALAEGILKALEPAVGERLAWGAYTAVSRFDWSIRARNILAFIKRSQ